MQNDIIDNSFESDEEFGLGMMFDKALNDPPCVTIIPVAWADRVIISSNDDLYDENPILDDSIDI